jgi:hypothetical protein
MKKKTELKLAFSVSHKAAIGQFQNQGQHHA